MIHTEKPKRQASFNESIRLRKRLIERGLSVSALAARIGRPRATVSKTLHHGRYPRVLKEVRKELGCED